MKNKINILGLLLLVMSCSCSQDEKIRFIDGDETGQQPPTNSDFPTAKEVILDMGPGFNLGNTYENGQNDTSFSSVKPVIDLYKAAGMTNVRIPTTWMDRFNGDHLADSEGNINLNHPRFLELVQVIDYALDQGLFV